MSANHGRRGRRWRRIRENFRAARIQPCAICDGVEGDIDYDAEANEPLAMELDHIVPLSVDPTRAEDPSNLRPVHAVCNRRRGAGSTGTPMVSSTHRDSHNYSAMAGTITSRDWSDDWSTNTWHSTHPDTPCPCRTTTPDTERTYSP